MRKLLATTALACLLSGTAIAGTLREADVAYISAAVGMMRVTSDCPGYELINGGLMGFADTNGVDGEKIGGAVVQIIKIKAGVPYNHDLVIPEVTRAFNGAWKEIDTFEAVDRVAFCWRWGGVLTKKGIIRRTK
jgi:hypothetical protein